MVLALPVGLVLGFLGSMPIAGPIAVLVLTRSLSGSPAQALRIALGSAAVEGLYAFLAFWGLGALLQELPAVAAGARVLAAALLVGIGVHLVRRKAPLVPAAQGLPPPPGAEHRSLLFGATIAALNPTIVASWAVIATALHGTGWVKPSLPDALAFGAGVAAGAVAWFALLVRLVRRFRRGLRPETVDRLLHAIGWLLVAAGVALATRTFV